MKYTQIMTATFKVYDPHYCRICPKFYHHRRSLLRHYQLAHRVDFNTHPLYMLWKRLTWRAK